MLNQQAVELAMAIGTALHCEIRPSTFHRKNYFYPDQAKDYQISQYDEPINVDGHLDLPDGSRVGIERAHMEEDTGKTTHAGASGRIHGADYSLVDYNRSGVPLVEIVSAPGHALRRPGPGLRDRAAGHPGRLRRLRRQDGGGLDAGRRQRVGAPAPATSRSAPAVRSRTSTRSGRSAGPSSTRPTARSPSSSRASRSSSRPGTGTRGPAAPQALRSKEDAYDYRYFLEPDLVPLVPDAEWIRAVADTLGHDARRAPGPAGRAARRGRRRHRRPSSTRWPRWSTSASTTWWSTAVAGGVGPALALARTANEAATDADAARRLDPRVLRRAADHGGQRARCPPPRPRRCWPSCSPRGGGDPAAIAAAKGFEAMSEDSLAATVAEAVAAHPDEWARYREGDDKLAGFFTGLVMKATKGQADGKAVAAELRRLRG